MVPEEKCGYIRRHARPKDWTQASSDNQLCELIQRFVDESKMIEKECSVLGIPFMDTGAEFKQSIPNVGLWEHHARQNRQTECLVR